MTFSVYFLIETNKLRFFFFKRSIVHVHIYFGLAEKSHNPVEAVDWIGQFSSGAGAGYIQVSLEQSLSLTQTDH